MKKNMGKADKFATIMGVLDDVYDKLPNKDFEFMTHLTKDANNQEYVYVHMKRYENEKTPKTFIAALKKRKIKFVVPQCNDYKCLIWVPTNQEIRFIVHSVEEVYEIGTIWK